MSTMKAGDTDLKFQAGKGLLSFDLKITWKMRPDIHFFLNKHDYIK